MECGCGAPGIAGYSLPKTLCPQRFHRRIVGHQRCAFDDRLCGEHAIERIAMRVIEAACLECVLIGDGEMGKSVCDDEFVELADGHFGAG